MKHSLFNNISLYLLFSFLIISGCRQESKLSDTPPSREENLPIQPSTASSFQDVSSHEMEANAKADEYGEEIHEENLLVADTTITYGGGLQAKDHTSLEIYMQLVYKKGQIKGKYFYHHTPDKVDILLEGKLEGNELSLQEYDKNHKLTGNFLGEFTDKATIKGVWQNPKHTSKLPFELRAFDMEYEQTKIIGLKADPEVEEDMENE
jgi:hypothetical protein